MELKLTLVLGDDTEGVEDTGEGRLGADADEGVFVEEVIDPGDLGDLERNFESVVESRCWAWELTGAK